MARGRFDVPSTGQRAPKNQEQSDGNGREDWSPPGQGQQEENVPVEQGMRPAAKHSQENVIKNVPDAEGNGGVAQPGAPSATSKDADGEQHDKGGRFPNHFGR